MNELHPIVIRRAKLAELPILQKLNKELIISDAQYISGLVASWSESEDGKKYFTRRINGRKGICLVAEMNGEIVGYTTGAILWTEKWRPFKRAELDNLYIKEKYRSQGIGKQLIAAYLDWCRSKGVERVILHTVASNDKAIRFYQRNNFTPHHLVLETTIQ